ncbi:MAG: SDR family oxidoreductase [Candidatus Schekmanbacteria bacterium]|nr:SDR family oxidoreductase [Candidatus Schekmanbacteria bacterium]
MMGALHNKNVLVTGASSGIGRAVILAVAREGACVIALARRADRLEALSAELDARGASHGTRVCDVRDVTRMRRVFGSIRDRYEHLDVLVVNAGLGYPSTIADGAVERWREEIETNLLGALVTIQEALPLMSTGGTVVVVSSVVGRKPSRSMPVYSATKFALHPITEALRLELRERGVRVTSVQPGLVRTEFAEVGQGADAASNLYQMFPPLEPEDVADAVVWAATRPPRVSVSEILIRPTEQQF